MQAFNVYIGSKLIDTVYYLDSFSKDDVRLSLINHDSYDSNIKVSKRRKLK
jgi:hypothetical protein